MSLPNSKAHSDSAAEKPSASANTAQRSGQGRWLRTITRGALIDMRLRSNFQRILGGPVVCRSADCRKTKAARGGLCTWLPDWRDWSALAELLATAGAVQTDLLALDLTRIARDEAGLLERRLE